VEVVKPGWLVACLEAGAPAPPEPYRLLPAPVAKPPRSQPRSQPTPRQPGQHAAGSRGGARAAGAAAGANGSSHSETLPESRVAALSAGHVRHVSGSGELPAELTRHTSAGAPVVSDGGAARPAASAAPDTVPPREGAAAAVTAPVPAGGAAAAAKGPQPSSSHLPAPSQLPSYSQLSQDAAARLKGKGAT
jgi:hypothetical protein